MSNSSLVSYKKISPNRNSPRNHTIDTISIHCMAGNLTVQTCGNLFASLSRSASSNYGIDSQGNIAMYVEEKDRSWCTSSSSNDNRAVTIEVANDGGASTGWHVSDKAMTSLINLCTDICRRNKIKRLLWKGDKSLIGNVSKQNMTVHRWFANKDCPGNYLYSKHSYIAAQVNAKLKRLELEDKLKELNAKTPYKVVTTKDGVKLRNKVGAGKIVKRYKKGKTLTVSKVYLKDNGLFYGKGRITKKYFCLSNTKEK